MRTQWDQKPYYSLDTYCKEQFGQKLYKVALDAGMTCPNRDGTLDTRGCIFCSAGGSGEFAIPASSLFSSVEASKKEGPFIAYFQSFTNTYAPTNHLSSLYREALSTKNCAGISIATRPDCFSPEIYCLLSRLRTEYPSQFIWIELGLQTIHEASAQYIRRGYPLSVFDQCMKELTARSIPVIVHVILGLPGETKEAMLQSVTYLNQFHPFGVKLSLLHILKGTDLSIDYLNGQFSVLEKEDYIALLLECLECLSPEIVIHRLTGDGPKDLLLAPLWSRDKRNVLNSLHKKMKENNSWQGKKATEAKMGANR